mmetsp:Transcript_8206/g.8041  ORF Transcript_8206/g.8041 Transcript_8206/m.8041 type:complete len:124 (+) Transcript_8206:698-1069(+)
MELVVWNVMLTRISMRLLMVLMMWMMWIMMLLMMMILMLSFDTSNIVLVQAAPEKIDYVDYTCFPRKDYAEENTCQTIADGSCDDPFWGGTGGAACRQQDCIDCGIHCKYSIHKTMRKREREI